MYAGAEMQLRYALIAVAATGLVTGCARSSTIPLTNDTVQITATTAPACGRTGAQSVAVRRAAIETLQRGFDRFIVQGAGYDNTIRVVGYTPIQAQTYGSQGFRSTTVYGGNPIIGGSHAQGLVVKMYRDDDPAGANGVSARATLGPDWKKQLDAGPDITC